MKNPLILVLILLGMSFSNAQENINELLAAGIDDAKVSIVDMQGRNVFTSSNVSSRISVANLQQGMYFLTLEMASGASSTKKFIKQ